MNKPMRLLIILIAFLAGLYLSSPAIALQPESADLSGVIRVAVLKARESITIEGKSLSAVADSAAGVSLNSPVQFRQGKGLVVYNGLSARRIRVSGDGNLRVNGKSYRGTIEVSVAAGGLLAVNELPLEQYLIGVINSEISSTWPMESVKAQAVIARTFAVHRREERKKSLYHMESTVMDQAYDGSDLEDSRAARGVHETDGLVLTHNGSVIQAFYHAACGGRTEESSNVWGVSLPYLKGVECQYCATASSGIWEQALPLSKIEASLKLSGLMDIKTSGRNSRGRVKTVLLSTSRGIVTMPATKFRMAVGSTIIKSTNFNLKVDNGTAFFSGTGYGHGVGLCQWGAKQRALDGFTYSEILSYYYPGTELRRLSGSR